MILYINSCVRSESRTDAIARALLDKLGSYEEVNLEEEGLSPLTREQLDKRTALIESGDFSDPMFKYAHQFQQADTIVISAPFWDHSFPASLKCYIENIYVTNLVSKYGEDGMPVGLCNAKTLYYVVTAGGPYVPEFSFGYIEALTKYAFGIGEVKLIKAEMLDVIGFDAEQIVADTIASLDELL